MSQDFLRFVKTPARKRPLSSFEFLYFQQLLVEKLRSRDFGVLKIGQGLHALVFLLLY